MPLKYMAFVLIHMCADKADVLAQITISKAMELYLDPRRGSGYRSLYTCRSCYHYTFSVHFFKKGFLESSVHMSKPMATHGPKSSGDLFSNAEFGRFFDWPLQLLVEEHLSVLVTSQVSTESLQHLYRKMPSLRRYKSSSHESRMKKYWLSR